MPTLLNSTSYKFILGNSRYNAYINGQKVFSDLVNNAYERSYSSDLIWDADSSTYKRPVTIAINPTPSDATVILTANGFTQSGNMITVGENTTVTYTISKSGYTTVTDTISSDVNKTISVKLSIAKVTLTINTNPIDATVKFMVDNYSEQDKKYISLPVGTVVNYEIFRYGMNSVFGRQVLTSNVTRSATLTYSIILKCNGREWDEEFTQEGLDLIYKWRYPTFNIYVNNILILGSVKPNNTFNIPNILPNNAYIIDETYKYIDYLDGDQVKTTTHNFDFGNLPAGGLIVNVPITTDYDGGSAMSSEVNNQSSYDIYITT